jgi:hypothetical protein
LTRTVAWTAWLEAVTSTEDGVNVIASGTGGSGICANATAAQEIKKTEQSATRRNLVKFATCTYLLIKDIRTLFKNRSLEYTKCVVLERQMLYQSTENVPVRA